MLLRRWRFDWSRDGPMVRFQTTVISRLAFMAGIFAASAANAACTVRCHVFDYASAPWSAAVELLNGNAWLSFASFMLEGRYQLKFPISWNIEFSWHDFSSTLQFAPDVGFRIDSTDEWDRIEQQRRRGEHWALNDFTEDPRMREISKVWVGWLDQPDPSNSAFVEFLESEGFTEQEIGRWASSMRIRDAWLGIPATFEGLPSEACEAGAYQVRRAVAQVRSLIGCPGPAGDPGVVK